MNTSPGWRHLRLVIPLLLTGALVIAMASGLGCWNSAHLIASTRTAVGSDDIAGYAGSTPIPARVIEDLLAAREGTIAATKSDMTGLGAARGTLEMVGKAAALIETARRAGLKPLPVGSQVLDQSTVVRSGLYQYMVGGVQFSGTSNKLLSPVTDRFLKENAVAASALWQQAKRSLPVSDQAARSFMEVHFSDVYSFGEGEDGMRRAKAAYGLIQAGWPIQKAVWENQAPGYDFGQPPSLVGRCGQGQGRELQIAIAGVPVGRPTKPFTDRTACIAVPLYSRFDRFWFDPKLSDAEAARQGYFGWQLQRQLDPQVSAVRIDWTSRTARLLRDWSKRFSTGFSTPEQRDQVSQALFEQSLQGLRTRDLPGIAERLCVSSCESISETGLREADLRTILANGGSADVRARLIRELLQEGKSREATHEASLYLRQGNSLDQGQYPVQLYDQEVAQMIQQSQSNGADPKDISVLQQGLDSARERLARLQQTLRLAKPGKTSEDLKRLMEWQRLVQDRMSSDRKRQDAETIPYFEGKLKYLSVRCDQLAAAERRSGAAGYTEAFRRYAEMRLKLENVQQQARSYHPVGVVGSLGR